MTRCLHCGRHVSADMDNGYWTRIERCSNCGRHARDPVEKKESDTVTLARIMAFKNLYDAWLVGFEAEINGHDPPDPTWKEVFRDGVCYLFNVTKVTT